MERIDALSTPVRARSKRRQSCPTATGVAWWKTNGETPGKSPHIRPPAIPDRRSDEPLSSGRPRAIAEALEFRAISALIHLCENRLREGDSMGILERQKMFPHHSSPWGGRGTLKRAFRFSGLFVGCRPPA